MKDNLIGVNVNTEKEDVKITLSNPYVILSDKSRGSFNTTKPAELLKYLHELPSHYKENEVFKPVLFADFTGETLYVDAYQNLRGEYGKSPLGYSKTEISSPLRRLTKLNDKWLGIDEFKGEMDKLEQFGGSSFLAFYNTLENLSINKIMKVNRKDDNRGNFSFSYEAAEGNGDAKFPRTIELDVPLFRGLDVKTKIELKLYFKWNMNSGGVVLLFNVENVMLTEIVEDAAKAYLEKLSDESDYEMIIGHFDIVNSTDAWKYHEIELTVNE